MKAATSPRKYRGVAAGEHTSIPKYPQTEQTPIDPLSQKTPLNDDKGDPNNYWTLINEEKDHEMEAERPTNNKKFVYFVVALVHIGIATAIGAVIYGAMQAKYWNDHCNETDKCEGCNMVEYQEDDTKYNKDYKITKDFKVEKGGCVWTPDFEVAECRHSYLGKTDLNKEPTSGPCYVGGLWHACSGEGSDAPHNPNCIKDTGSRRLLSARERGHSFRSLKLLAGDVDDVVAP
jgi:hypothetical protein